MNVVGHDHVVEHAQPEAFPWLEQPVQVTPPVTRDFERKRFVVAAVRDVPEPPGYEMTIGAAFDSAFLER